VTKDGAIAGPRVLEHMVDAVLYFEGDRDHAFRIVRAVKNRFGSSSEIGIFEMGERGLVGVGSPSAALLSERANAVSGSAVMAAMEGSRPLLVEIQALVTPSYLPAPRRLATGIDTARLLQVLAVLERRAGLSFAGQDVYVSVAGGVRVLEPALDLPLALALASALKDRPVPLDVASFGELGLTGQVRPVSQAGTRVKEAARFGMKRVLGAAPASLDASEVAALARVETVADALTVLN
jgi:DNA repair protein RadA/Sms